MPTNEVDCSFYPYGKPDRKSTPDHDGAYRPSEAVLKGTPSETTEPAKSKPSAKK